MSAMTNDHDRILRHGQRRLKALLPKARAEARKATDTDLRAGSGMAKAALPWMTEKNLLALTVSPGEAGGWSADIVLPAAPPGVPRTFGTPVSEPLETEAEAERAAYDLLVTVLASEHARDKEDATPPAAHPVFQLYNLELRLNPGAFEAVLTGMPPSERSYASPQAAINRIEEVLAEVMPGGFSRAAFEALADQEINRIFAVAHMAALTGVVRYPPMVAAPPRSKRH
jgi:hypothetical protein